MEEIYRRISNDNDFGIDFDKNERSNIQDFFRGEILFLTGCTGFLGKCFVEKLLRACRLKKLYLMVRPLKEPVSERAKNYFKHEIFSKLRESLPNFESRVFFIEGNLMQENFGMSVNEYNAVVNEVTMIIHNASNVKFDTEVHKILRTNVYGTQYVLNLAKNCRNMKVFSYVSTAYSHSYRQHIEEKCYPPPGDLKMIEDFIEADESSPGAFTEEKRYAAVKPWPNIYTYSKATAESLVEEFAKHVTFRCVIYRPSIVMSTYEEPIPAWCGNINGPVSAIIGGGLGIVRAIYKSYQPMDFIPADMCTNALFSIMWDSVVNRAERNTVLVYNYGSSTVRPISLVRIGDHMLPRFWEIPSKKQARPYWVHRTSCPYYYFILHVCCHVVPAMFADLYLLLLQFEKPKLTLLAFKITKQLHRIFFFINGNWRIHVHETIKMWDRMNGIDKQLFYSDLRTLDWSDYSYNYWPGIKRWILDEVADDDGQYSKIINFRERIYWSAIGIIYMGLLMFVWRYFGSWILLLISPFIDLARLICCTLL